MSSPAISAGTTNGAVPTSTLLENLPDAIVLVDEGGAVRYANAAAELLFGQPIEELTRQGFASLLAEPFAGEYEGFLRSHGAGGADSPSSESAGRSSAATRAGPWWQSSSR